MNLCLGIVFYNEKEGAVRLETKVKGVKNEKIFKEVTVAGANTRIADSTVFSIFV